MKPHGVVCGPTVSIVIPTFNTERYIGAALASAFSQSFSGHEVIVVDDGSHDPSLLKKALTPYSDRIIFLSSENRGPSAARNLGIAAATGEFIAFLDSDDIWMPHHLSDRLKAFSLNPSLDLVYADAMLFGESPLSGKTFMQVTPSTGQVTLESLLSLQCSVITSCVVVRKESLMRVGCFDEKLRLSEDFDLWLRLAYSGCQMGYQPRLSAYHRIHDRSLTNDRVASCESERAVYLKLLSSLTLTAPLQKGILEQVARCRAELALENGKRQLMASEYRGAAEQFDRAVNHYRSPKLYLARVGLKVAPKLLLILYRSAQLFYRIRSRSRSKHVSEMAKDVQQL
jgi:glycosyltransferase involved in cell wall biosynthesis